MSIRVGTILEAYDPSILGVYIVGAATVDSDGASIIVNGIVANAATRSDAATGEIALLANELVGKIGAIIGVYDPEASNRLIQEF